MNNDHTPARPWGDDYVGAEWPVDPAISEIFPTTPMTPWRVPIIHTGLKMPKKKVIAEVPPGYFRRHWLGRLWERDGCLFVDGSLGGRKIVGRYMFEERRVAFVSFIMPFDPYPTREELDVAWTEAEAALRVNLDIYGKPAIEKRWRTVWDADIAIVEIKAHFGKGAPPIQISISPR